MRADFALPMTGALYFCPQRLAKFHPDFDVLLRGILERDATGQIVVLAGPQRRALELLQLRFARTIGNELARRILFIPSQSSNDYLRLLSVMDVVLDMPAYSAALTGYDAFGVGVPVVTQPGRHMVQRYALGLYRQMGIEELVASNAAEYVNLAVELGRQPDFRHAIRREIADRCDVLYEDGRVVDDVIVSWDGHEYIPGDGMFSIWFGCSSSMSETITVTPINDARSEGDHDIRLIADSLVGTTSCCGGESYSILNPTPAAVVTIADDDEWTISVASDTDDEAVEADSQDSASMTITRSGATDMRYPIQVGSSMGGDATRATDYVLECGGATLTSDSVEIPGGATSVTVSAKPVNDVAKESDEAVTLNTVTGGTSVGVGGGIYGADPFHPDDFVYILDDDHWHVSLEEPFAVTPPTVIYEEGETSTLLVLSRTHEVMTPSRTGDTTYPIDVTFAYSGHASANDYTMIEYVYQPGGGTAPVTRGGGTTSFQIQEGHTQKDIDIKVVDDTLVERLNEWLVITATDASHGGQSYPISQSQNEVELVIRDNDKLELHAMGFLGDLPLLSDPTDAVPNAYEWQNGYNWHSVREFGENPTSDYVPAGYASSDVPSAGGYWKPADVDPAIANNLFAFFEVDINGVRYSAAIPLFQRPDGYWQGSMPASLSSTFAAMQGQKADYRPDLVTKWYIFAGVDAAEVGGVNPQDGLLAEEQEAIRHTGDAESCLYVTYKTPVTAAGPLYHTVVHTGCVAAKPVTGDDAVVFDAIWGKFETRSINKINIEGGAIVEGEVLSYYGKDVEDPANYDIIKSDLEVRISDTDGDGDWDLVHPDQWPTRAREFGCFQTSDQKICLHVHGLLLKFDGTCGAWKEMAMGVFGAQGITTTGKSVVPSNAALSFRVKSDRIGQGGVAPGESIFSDHGFIEYDGKCYDPSYGVPYGDTDTALSVFAGNMADLGVPYWVNGYIPDLDPSLVSQLDTLRYSYTDGDGDVHDVVRVTLMGYGIIYEPTDTSPAAADFKWK